MSLHAGGEDLPAQVRESNEEMEELRLKVQDLERRLGAVHRQLQMQGEVSQLAESLGEKLNLVLSVWETKYSDLVVRIERVEEAQRVLRDEFQGKIQRLEAEVKAVTDLARGMVFACDSSQPLKGIIEHLTSECGGNVQEVVEVTASSCYSGEPKSVAELGKASGFQSNNEADSWICYNFKDRRVAPESYSIRSHDGLSHPKSWDLEVSNDGASWKVVDSRKNNSSLNGNYLIRNFKINPSPCEGFRFVRLRQTGPTHYGDNILYLNSLELFGRLSPP